MTTTRLYLIAVCLVALFAAACSGEPPPEPTAPDTPPAPSAPQAPSSSSAPGSPPAPAAPPVPAPPAFPTGLPVPITIALASTDLAVGANRVVFAVIQMGVGPLRDAEVEVQTFHLNGAQPDTAKQTLQAAFRAWPGGAGVYVIEPTFDAAGEWGLGIDARLPDGSKTKGGVRVNVAPTSLTPPIGSDAPRTVNKTARDVAQLDELTTDTEPDADLYQKTIADALDEGRPLLVSFSTPAYCRTGTCGPQLDAIKQLKSERAGAANFIHVEVYDNPAEIREQGIASARVVPALVEWGLPSEPWTFVIDADGVIRAKFEGFVSAEELRESLDALP